MFVFHPIKRCYGGSVQRSPVHRELRTVTRTIQHVSNEFQCRWHPTCVHAADLRSSSPDLSRYAAHFERPWRIIAPVPGFSSSNDLSSPGAK